MTRYIALFLTCFLLLTACGADETDTDLTNAESTPESALAAEDAIFADAPQPVIPTDDTVFDDHRDITLKWEWHRPLNDDEYFDVRIWQPGERDQTVSFVTEKELYVSDWLQTKPWGIYLWSVTAVTGEIGTDGKDAISPNSPIRRFIIGEIDSPRLNPVLVENGEAIYNNGITTADGNIIPSCLSCHTADGLDNALAPAIIGQWDRLEARNELLSVREYVHASLLDPNEFVPEGYGPWLMYQEYATILTDEQLRAVVEYTLSLAAQ